MSRVILITGANAGIGFELVRLLAEKKHTVYLGARNEVAGKKAEEKLHAEGLKNVKFVQLDVTDSTTINATREIIENADGKLDVLVNNAAFGGLEVNEKASCVSLSIVRQAMEVNFFGVIQTTTALLPLMRKSDNGVIVNVSSELGSNTGQANPAQVRDHFTAYDTSKAALNSYTIALAQELRGEGFKVNAVTPGLTSTKLSLNRGKSAREGAEVLLPWALLEKDGPTCLFIGSDQKEHVW